MEGVEDCLLWIACEEVEEVVGCGAVGCGGVEEQAVGLGGAGDGGEPAVEDGEFVGEGGEDGEGLGIEALHDGEGEGGGDG